VLRYDEAKTPLVRQVFELAAASCTDWEVAAQSGLAKTHVGEILTNPIYMGRLRTGEPAGNRRGSRRLSSLPSGWPCRRPANEGARGRRAGS
jgi:hypothetical protein